MVCGVPFPDLSSDNSSTVPAREHMEGGAGRRTHVVMWTGVDDRLGRSGKVAANTSLYA